MDSQMLVTMPSWIARTAPTMRHSAICCSRALVLQPADRVHLLGRRAASNSGEAMGRTDGRSPALTSMPLTIRTIWSALLGWLTRLKRPLTSKATANCNQRAAIAFAALKLLRAELSELQAAMPQFLLQFTEPIPSPLLVDGTGELSSATTATGPWDVDVTLQGSHSDMTYSAPIVLRVRFSANWPREAPLVRVGGLLSFPLLMRDRTLPSEFYERLSRTTDSGSFRVAVVLQGVRNFLLDPASFFGHQDINNNPDEKAQKVHAWMRDVRRVNEKRLGVIRKYASIAKHPTLFSPLQPLCHEWFNDEFLAASQKGTSEAWRSVLTEHLPGEVYSMPLFSEAFCGMLLEEIFCFYASGLPARRPNSMNNYGIILSDIGLEPFVNKLQHLLQPVGRFLFGFPGSSWDGHHCFIVRYREGEDLGLDMHTDDSDVTFNICLGLDFRGAGLQFCGNIGDPKHRHHSLTYQHQKGRCVVHLGRKRHGADDISSGERLNLILWNHSSTYRKSKQYRSPDFSPENGPPEPMCLSYTHDRDFGIFKPYPVGKEAFRTRGWCPPKHAEYEGFKPDVVHPSKERGLRTSL
mmetsp:Transcript_52896/g.105103  ORF Transcript_52896/g.105103 Transcript_52896/m.105103 type:complete len:579 (-) Transcript_52896:21-1757(-)